MFTLLLLLSSLTFCFSFELTQQANVQGVFGVVADNNEIRALAAVYNDVEDTFAVGGLKYSIQVDGASKTIKGELDAGGFKFVGGGGITPTEPKFALAALQASADFHWDANANGGKIVYSITGAWVELVFGISSIFLYKNQDSAPGFQYILGDNIWDCTKDNDKDCFLWGSGVSLKDDLKWGHLSDLYANRSCSDAVPGGSFNSSCTIYQLTAVGKSKVTDAEVIRITWTTASQKVLINGHVVGPDSSKIDLTINYPYTEKVLFPLSKNDYSVGVTVYASGKSGTASVEGAVRWNNNEAFAWKTASGRTAVLAWDGNAELTTAGVKSGSPVYIQGISGQSIIDYDCTNCDVVSKIIIPIWQGFLSTYKAFGWTGQFVILSWAPTAPDTVYYDPSMAMASESEVTYHSGIFVACYPTLFFSFLSVIIVHYLFINH
jgi:hypothetical protein